jgi:hypothetical protein
LVQIDHERSEDASHFTSAHGADRGDLPSDRLMGYSTPMLLIMGALMVFIAWLSGIEPWLIAVGAVVAVIGFLLERRHD